MFSTAEEYNLKFDYFYKNINQYHSKEHYNYFKNLYNSAVSNNKTTQMSHLIAFRIARELNHFQDARNICITASKLNQNSPYLENEKKTISTQIASPPVIGAESKSVRIHDPYNAKAQKQLRAVNEIQNKQSSLTKTNRPLNTKQGIFRGVRNNEEIVASLSSKLEEGMKQEQEKRMELESEQSNEVTALKKGIDTAHLQINIALLKTQKEMERKNQIEIQKRKELQNKINNLITSEKSKLQTLQANQQKEFQEILTKSVESKKNTEKKENTRIRLFNSKVNNLLDEKKASVSEILNEKEGLFFHEALKNSIIIKSIAMIRHILDDFRNNKKGDYLFPDLFIHINNICPALDLLFELLLPCEEISSLDFYDVYNLIEASWYIQTSGDKFIEIVNKHNIQELKNIGYKHIIAHVNNLLNKTFNKEKFNEEHKKTIRLHLKTLTLIRHVNGFVSIASNNNQETDQETDQKGPVDVLQNIIKDTYTTKSSKDIIESKKTMLRVLEELLPTLACFAENFKKIEGSNCEEIWQQYLSIGLESIFQYDLNPKDSLKKLILMACRNGTLIAFKIYLKKALDIGLSLAEKFEVGELEVQQKNENNSIPLLVNTFRPRNNSNLLLDACSFKRLEIVKLLISHKVDTTVKNKNGRNAFHMACESGDIEIMKELLEVNPKFIDMPDNQGQTPAWICSITGNIEVALFLKQNGVDFTKGGIDGVTPAKNAFDNQHIQMIMKLFKIDTSNPLSFASVHETDAICHVLGALESLGATILPANNTVSPNDEEMTSRKTKQNTP